MPSAKWTAVLEIDSFPLKFREIFAFFNLFIRFIDIFVFANTSQIAGYSNPTAIRYKQ